MISVITPSIRPRGLEQTFKTLQNQSVDFEWLPRLSTVKSKPDLCYQMNQAIREAKGELIVFLQDWIKIRPDGLQLMWDYYKANPNTAVTCPVGKVDTVEELVNANFAKDGIRWDWRIEKEWEVEYHHWEIDWGFASKDAIIKAGMFFEERYDDGFGWENVDLAYRMMKQGVKFKCFPRNIAIAFDHDKNERHPYKSKPNQDLWLVRKGAIDLEYGDSKEM